MKPGPWTIIYGATVFILVAVIGVSMVYTPEPMVVIYNDAMIEPSQNWNMYRLNITHLGLAPEDCVVGSGLVLEWRTERLNHGEYAASKSSPAVYRDTVFVGLDTGALVAVDRESGEIEWSFYTRRSRNGIHGSPCVDPSRGLVYIGAYDGWIYAVDIDSGIKVWENRLGSYIGSSPTLYNDVVYIGVEMDKPDGYIVGVDADTGREVFRTDPLGDHPHSTPSVDPVSRCVFIGENDGDLYSYWLNGSMRWSYHTGSAIKSTPAILDGVVYITSWDRKLHAVNISTGEPLWVFTSGASSMSSPTINPDNGLIYFGNHGGLIYAVNSTTGDDVWRYKTGDMITASPTLVQSTNTVIIGSKDKGVYLLDAMTGEVKQKLELLSGFTGVPVAVGDHLYLFDHLGYLYSYRMG